MKPAPFEYVRPASVDEAVALLSEHEDAKVLAGGQSLVPVLNMRLLRPTLLVDVARLGLDALEVRNGSVAVGACVTQRAFAESPLCPQLAAEALPHVGHFVTRNRGTVCGSVAHADAAAELPLVLTVLGGSVVTNRREIPAEEFFLGPFMTVLEPGELVVETLWPRLDGWRFAFEEFAQRRGDYGLSVAAVALRLEDDIVAEARVGLASVAPAPTLLDVGIAGSRVDAESARAAGEAAAVAIEPWDNLHASADYQRQLTRVLVERALLRAAA
jgi:carbon-monoxide dehydrogenase medium subunit